MLKAKHARVSRHLRSRWAVGKADRAVLTSVNVWLWDVCSQAADPKRKGTEDTMGERHPFIMLVNREADRLTRAMRAAIKETVRDLPGRAQKDAIDVALRKVAPKIRKVLEKT